MRIQTQRQQVQQQQQPRRGPSGQQPQLPSLFPPPQRPGLTPGQPAAPRWQSNDYDEDDNSSDHAPQRPAAPRPPTRDEIAIMSLAKQHDLVRASEAQLRDALTRLPGGDHWKQFLLLDELRSAVAGPAPDELTPASREQLQKLVQRFNQVSGKPDYRVIWESREFTLLQLALSEYVVPPITRARRQVAASRQALAKSLERLDGGDGWKQYLETEQLLRLSRRDDAPQPADADVLRKLLKCYDDTAENPEFRKIAQAQGFQATRAALRRYVVQAKIDSQPEQPGHSGTGPKDMDRMVRAVLQNLKAIQQACQEESAARQALVTVKPATPEAEKAQSMLALIKQRHDAEMQQAQDGLGALLTAIKKQGQRDRAMQTPRLANSDDILKTMKQLQSRDPSNSVLGLKVHAAMNKTETLATTTLSLAE